MEMFKIGSFDLTPSKEQEEKIKLLELKNVLIRKLKNFNFEGFIHTTEFENFKSIIRDGYLFPRNELVKNNKLFEDRAEQGVLGKTENFIKCCCRFYYYFDTPTNYNADYKKEVVLVFDESIMKFEKGVFFAPHNACYGSWTNSVEKALNFDWEGIFERGDRNKSKYCNGELTKEITREISKIRNAEFLIKGNVSIEYIKKIIVRDYKVFDDIKNFCGPTLMNKVELRLENDTIL